MTTPAGWYPDTNPGTERWWDGERWTEQTRPTPPSPNRTNTAAVIAVSILASIGIILALIPGTMWFGPILLSVGLIGLGLLTRRRWLFLTAAITAPFLIAGGIVAAIAVNYSLWYNSPEQVADRLAQDQRVTWMTACELRAENATGVLLDVDYGATVNDPTADGTVSGTVRLTAADGSFVDAACTVTGVDSIDTATVTSLTVDGSSLLD